MTKKQVLVAIDPGDTAGIAIFSAPSYQLEKMDQVNYKNFDDYMTNLASEFDIKMFVIEEYIVFHKKAGAHAGSKLRVKEQIGAIGLMSKLLGVPMERQMSSILKIAEKQSGMKMPHTHSETHKFSAFLHGWYYLHKKGLIKSALEMEEDKKHGRS